MNYGIAPGQLAAILNERCAHLKASFVNILCLETKVLTVITYLMEAGKFAVHTVQSYVFVLCQLRRFSVALKVVVGFFFVIVINT